MFVGPVPGVPGPLRGRARSRAASACLTLPPRGSFRFATEKIQKHEQVVPRKLAGTVTVWREWAFFRPSFYESGLIISGLALFCPLSLEATPERGDCEQPDEVAHLPAQDAETRIGNARCCRARPCACGMRVACNARVAPPRVDTRRGARTKQTPNAKHIHRYSRMGRSPRWRLDTSVSPVATWASPPPSPHARRVHTKAKGNDSDTEPCEGGSMGASARKRKPPKSTPLSASFSHRDGDFFYGNGDADDVLERSLPDRFATRNDPLRHEVRCLETSHAGSVFGAVALITGSTVGAGVLALPETVSPAGIGPSSVVLFLCWGLLLAEALLLAEVNVFLMRERDEYRLVHGRGHSPVAISLGEMAGRTLGAEGTYFQSPRSASLIAHTRLTLSFIYRKAQPP